jgi:hypothetical protein
MYIARTVGDARSLITVYLIVHQEAAPLGIAQPSKYPAWTVRIRIRRCSGGQYLSGDGPGIPHQIHQIHLIILGVWSLAWALIHYAYS